MKLYREINKQVDSSIIVYLTSIVYLMEMNLFLFWGLRFESNYLSNKASIDFFSDQKENKSKDGSLQNALAEYANITYLELAS